MFEINPYTLYSLAELREKLHGLVSLDTFLERTDLRNNRAFCDCLTGHEMLEGIRNAKSFSEIDNHTPVVNMNPQARGKSYRNVTANIRLKKLAPSKAELTEKQSIAQPEQIRELLPWLRENAPMVYVWTTLQALTGMRVFEVAYLHEQDFNPNAQAVTITASEAKDPKNLHSYREIPVADKVARVLSRWIGNMKVRHPKGYLFFPSKGSSWSDSVKLRETRTGAYSQDRIKHLWSHALKKARCAGVQLPDGFIPRKLRASFVTAMRKAGADFGSLQRYIGHAPSSVMAAHYDEIDTERMRTIAKLAQELYEASGAFKSSEKNALKTL